MTTPYPEFFDRVPRLRLRDPLAAFLGAAQDGVIEYGYADAVKLAGHSCPTVAGAYGLTRRALAALYRDELPQRGAIRVALREPADAGVAGVVASVVGLLTGAAGDAGFKGIAGRFVRRGLLAFGADLPLDLRFVRADSGAGIDAAAQVARVPPDPQMTRLLQAILAGGATPEDARQFADLWQDRVRRILLDHGDDPEVFVLRPAA